MSSDHDSTFDDQSTPTKINSNELKNDMEKFFDDHKIETGIIVTYIDDRPQYYLRGHIFDVTKLANAVANNVNMQLDKEIGRYNFM